MASYMSLIGHDPGHGLAPRADPTDGYRGAEAFRGEAEREVRNRLSMGEGIPPSEPFSPGDRRTLKGYPSDSSPSLGQAPENSLETPEKA